MFEPLISLVLQFAGGGANLAADRLDVIFWFILMLYGLAFAIFAAAFWTRTAPSSGRSAATASGLLIVQIVLGLLVSDELLLLVAAELALVLTPRQSLKWLCAQLIAYVALRLSYTLYTSDGTHLSCNMMGHSSSLSEAQRIVNHSVEMFQRMVFQAIAFCVGYLAATEKRNRIKLAAAHAETIATRQLLGDAVRASERISIARDLHDAIGHHLTAVNLHLDLAMRQAGEPVIESLRASRELAQQLLSDVRAIVSTERSQPEGFP